MTDMTYREALEAATKRLEATMKNGQLPDETRDALAQAHAALTTPGREFTGEQLMRVGSSLEMEMERSAKQAGTTAAEYNQWITDVYLPNLRGLSADLANDPGAAQGGGLESGGAGMAGGGEPLGSL